MSLTSVVVAPDLVSSPGSCVEVAASAPKTVSIGSNESLKVLLSKSMSMSIREGLNV